MHTFLCVIIDKDIKNTRKKRKRLYSNEFAPNEETAPVNAPNWTKSGYNGTLKKSIENYLSPQEKDIDKEESSDDDDDSKENEDNDNSKENEDDDVNDKVDNNDNSDKKEHNEQEKRTERRSRSLVLVRYDSDYDGV